MISSGTYQWPAYQVCKAPPAGQIHQLTFWHTVSTWISNITALPSRCGPSYGQKIGSYVCEVVRRPPTGLYEPAAEKVWTPDRADAVPVLQRTGWSAGALRKGEKVCLGWRELQHSLQDGETNILFLTSSPLLSVSCAFQHSQSNSHQNDEAECFLTNLAMEVHRRLQEAGLQGRRVTLRVMVRKPGAPVESAKYGGHGICDNWAR